MKLPDLSVGVSSPHSSSGAESLRSENASYSSASLRSQFSRRGRKFVPISEAAKILGVSIDTVRRWNKSGIIQSVRPDGKNRFFSQDELEKYKFDQPLPISEAAKKLGISAITLRRLESKGLIKPIRNNAGERVYTKDSLNEFLNYHYSRRQKGIKKEESEYKPPEKFEEPKKLRLSKSVFLAITVELFFLLVNISIGNIKLHAANISLSIPPAILGETEELINNPERAKEATPGAKLEATSGAKLEITPTKIVKVKIEDESEIVNIRQEPTINSKIIDKAKNGDVFELVSIDSEWYKVKLASESGFIFAKYAVLEEKTDE